MVRPGKKKEEEKRMPRKKEEKRTPTFISQDIYGCPFFLFYGCPFFLLLFSFLFLGCPFFLLFSFPLFSSFFMGVLFSFPFFFWKICGCPFFCFFCPFFLWPHRCPLWRYLTWRWGSQLAKPLWVPFFFSAPSLSLLTAVWTDVRMPSRKIGISGNFCNCSKFVGEFCSWLATAQ